MMGWPGAERRASRLVKDLDLDDIHDHLHALREYVQDLSHGVSAGAHRQYGRAREFA